VTWAGGAPLTTTYTYQLVEWTQVLQAKTGASTTTYLYGLHPLGEFGTQSVYYLTDGAGSIRQLANPSGFIVLSRWYEPFGQMLAQRGAAVATYGYLGAQLDRVTGLVYVRGRYYDPVTGRFLTPGGGANPYAPQIAGALLGPLAILSAAAQRDRKRRRWVQALAVVLLLLAVGGMLISCDGPRPDPTPPRPGRRRPARCQQHRHPRARLQLLPLRAYRPRELGIVGCWYKRTEPITCSASRITTPHERVRCHSRLERQV